MSNVYENVASANEMFLSFDDFRRLRYAKAFRFATTSQVAEGILGWYCESKLRVTKRCPDLDRDVFHFLFPAVKSYDQAPV